jgi:hypothetical protein
MAVPTLQYLVAFSNAPTDDPALITTVATPPGTLGGANVWTDISPWVKSDDHHRGRQQELATFEAGEATFTLRNDDNRFTPWNTSSPYAGLVIPKKLVSIVAKWSGTSYQRWMGQVSGWQTNWPSESTQTVTLKVADAFRFLNMADITSTGYAAQVLADGATGYWRLGDPVGSTTAADSSGNNNALTAYGAAGGVITFGNTGALVADPTTSSLLSIANQGYAEMRSLSLTTVTPSGGVSMDIWLQPSTAAAVAWQINLAFTVSGTRRVLGVLGINTTTVQLIDLAAGAPGGSTNITTPNLCDGNWHHLAVSVTTAFAAVLYVDGVQVGTWAGGTFGTNTSQYLGPLLFAIGSAVTVGYQDFAVYPSVLSAAKVAKHVTLASFPQQSTDARLGRVLDTVGWSTGARGLDAGKSTVQAVTSSLTSTSALAHMQQVEATESGALFMGVGGRVKFLSRTTLLSNSLYTTSQATLGDNTAAGDIPFLPGGAPGRDDQFTYNEAVAARTGGATQTSIDQTSIDVNGRTTWQPPATLIGISDSEVLNLTQYVVTKFATPQDRLQSITVDLYSLANSLPAVIPTLLSLDLLYRVTVERTVMPGGGDPFTQVANIEHIQETISPNQWLITFALAIADPAWWVLGTAGLGQTTRLAF